MAPNQRSKPDFLRGRLDPVLGLTAVAGVLAVPYVPEAGVGALLPVRGVPVRAHHSLVAGPRAVTEVVLGWVGVVTVLSAV